MLLLENRILSVSILPLYKCGDPEKPRVYLLTPTAVAAVNINSSTIYPDLGIGIDRAFFPLSDK